MASRGAAVVEMALVTPFLLVLLLGVVESSWLLARSIDVAEAAREAGRLAGVNQGDTATIVTAVCSSMDDPTGAVVSLGGAGNGLGGTVSATVYQDAGTITGFLDPILSPPVHISHTTYFVLEQRIASWTDTTGTTC